MLSVLFLFNPYAGKGRIKTSLWSIIQTLTKEGAKTTVFTTLYQGHARDIILQMGDQFDRIVVSGGDGTLNEAIDALCRMDQPPALGYIPAGSTNDYARSLDLPKSMKEATKVAIRGQVFYSDIGLLNERHFAYVAAFGAFTEVSYKTPQEFKNLLGHQAYLLEGIKHLDSFRPVKASITCEEGEVLEDEFIFGMISNAKVVAGFPNLGGTTAELNDELFEGTFICNPTNPMMLNDIVLALISGKESRFVRRFKTRRASIHFEQPTNWVVDGEFGGTLSEAKVEVRPRVLPILVPPLRKNSGKKATENPEKPIDKT